MASPVKLTDRPDFAVIGEIVEPGSRVLDLGCGEGELLAWLVENKKVLARGLEISPTAVQKAITRGVSAYQGDIESSLPDYPDRTFDYVILSQTLQETRKPLPILKEMLRVGKRAIVSFPNFGHYSVRISMLLQGRSPVTKHFPYFWYDTPNVHFLSIHDFEDFCRTSGFPVARRYFLSGATRVTAIPNLLARTAVFLLG
jgi:methionine biosynthesis protein MetW